MDCTLREGEQFARARFTSDDRLALARALDRFGVDVLELTSPAASPGAEADLRRVAGLGLDAQVVTHVRCHPDDLARAADCGVDGVHVFLGSSAWSREHGHRRGLPRLLADLEAALDFLHGRGLPARFSCEDAFRSEPGALLTLLRHADALGVARVGLADTVGAATPEQVTELVRRVRGEVACELEFHGHNDGGCAVANAWAAWRAGATHVDTTVLGIGERNGIASLSGLVALLVLHDPGSCADLALDELVALDERVAALVGIEVPFNASISAPGAFTHKAGLHAKAVLSDPRSYEALDPALFARERTVAVGHALTGRHALAHRARALGLQLDDAALRRAAAAVKAAADARPLTDDDVDALLRAAAPLTTETRP